MTADTSWTGERLETFVFNDNTTEHLHRYAISIDFVLKKTVLDIACGEGYGSNIISKYAEKVIGVDLDADVIAKAKVKYQSHNLEFFIGSADQIPLGDNLVDVVVSFETIEHHDKHQEMMKEIKRVLKKDGILIISTPDKKYYSDNNKFKNPFHIKELYSKEFKDLVSGNFRNARFYFQNMFIGSLIVPEKDANGLNFYSGDYKKINYPEQFVPMYLIAISSDSPLSNDKNCSAFDGQEISNRVRDGVEERIRKQVRKEVYEETVAWITNSWSYRIGNAILKPFKSFKNIKRK